LPREITTTILLAVLGKGEITMTQLQKETGFSTITVLNHVEGLVTADLLEERRETTLPKRRFVRLSKEGMRIATTLNLLANSLIDPKTLIDLGAKAGRMGAYREAVTILRPQNVTRDYAIAELLVKDLETLVESIATVQNALPSEFAKGTLNAVRDKLNAQTVEARKYLQQKDIRRSAETVGQAWKEYDRAGKNMEDFLACLRDKKLEELAKVIEFIAPKSVQKG
jgi:DNA-binding MarR family transcriptional regulator